MSPLDRPVWASLNTHHAATAEGGPLARRFAPDVSPFASACDDTPAALSALAELVPPGGQVCVLQVPPVVVPPGCVVSKSAPGVQMVAARGLGPHAPCDDIRPLTESDAPDMVALAHLTEPGPFLARTHTIGPFLGVRVDGQLVAMAGERLRLPGYTEVSGVCTHPAFRGRGLARRLSAAVAARIEARGECAFLHAWASNHAAITLYEHLGFERRCAVNVVMIKRG